MKIVIEPKNLKESILLDAHKDEISLNVGAIIGKMFIKTINDIKESEDSDILEGLEGKINIEFDWSHIINL